MLKMLNLAKNERGIRMASAAIILLPLAALVCANSKSQLVDIIAIFSWFSFAAAAFIAFLYERAEEEEEDDRRE